MRCPLSSTAGSPTPESPRRHAPPAERRAQILAAALECFSEKGYHAATMDDLVRASGLSKGSLYWHFRNKDDVFLALFDAFNAEILGALQDVLDQDAPALARLRRFGEILVAALGSEGERLGAWIGFFAHPRARERLAEVYRTSRRLLTELLAGGVASGELRDLPSDGMAAALTAAIEGLFLQAMVDPAFDLRDHWESVWEMIRKGIER